MAFKFVTYEVIEQPISKAIHDAFDKLTSAADGYDWWEVAHVCADEAIKSIVEDNAPRLWFHEMEAGTEGVVMFICSDPDAECKPKVIEESPRCNDCGERLPENTGETFCGDDCEENFNHINETDLRWMKFGENISDLVPDLIQQLIDEGLVGKTEEEEDGSLRVMARSTINGEPLIGLYLTENKEMPWEILWDACGRESNAYTTLQEAVNAFRIRLAHMLAEEARQEIMKRVLKNLPIPAEIES